MAGGKSLKIARVREVFCSGVFVRGRSRFRSVRQRRSVKVFKGCLDERPGLLGLSEGQVCGVGGLGGERSRRRLQGR